MPQPDNRESAGNVPLDDDEAATLHRMVHQVDELHRRIVPLLGVAEAYLRGGKIAAHAAMRRLKP